MCRPKWASGCVLFSEFYRAAPSVQKNKTKKKLSTKSISNMDPCGSAAERCCCSVPIYFHGDKGFQQPLLELGEGCRLGGGSVRSAHLLQNTPERKTEREGQNLFLLTRLRQRLLHVRETKPRVGVGRAWGGPTVKLVCLSSL